MKNKIITLSVLILMTIGLTSCLSSKVEVTPEMGPVAIMSINISNKIEWEDVALEAKENGDGVSLGSLMAKKAINKADDEDALADLGFTKPLFNDAVKACYDIFENTFNCAVIPEEQLFAVSDYAYADEDLAYKIAYDQPNNYKSLSYYNTINSSVAEKTGAKTLAFITFDVYKVMDKGIGKNGTCKGSVQATVTLVDENGKFIAQFSGYSRTEETVAAVLGIVNNGELVPYIAPVFHEALYNALNYLPYKAR